MRNLGKSFNQAVIKRLIVGITIGIVTGLFIGIGTEYVGFLNTLLDGYEFRSYDARMRAKARGAVEGSLEDVVVIDIDQTSIEMLGNYKDWTHAYHGQVIDVVSSGNPKVLLFDIIFDRENSSDYELVKSLVIHGLSRSVEENQASREFLHSHDPNRFVQSTSASGKVIHSLVFEQEDPNSFLFKMDKETEGYEPSNHILQIPEEDAKLLPTADRFGNTYVEILNGAKRVGSANFPQDDDGIIRRAPTAIYFKGPKHVYPSLSMAAILELLDIPPDGLDYDFTKHLLKLKNREGTVVREIPIDDHGRMFVNYYGPYKTFSYVPYSYVMDPSLLPPEYWDGKVGIVGATLPGLMDLRNTPVLEAFPGVEIHSNIIHSALQNEFIKVTNGKTNLSIILILSAMIGLLCSISPRPILSIAFPLVAIAVWVWFAYDQAIDKRVMWQIVRPSISMSLSFLGLFLHQFFIVEKDKRYLKKTFGTYVSPEIIDKMYKDGLEPQLGGEEGYHTAFFSDIQGFSSFSEKLTPSDLVILLNDYLSEMTTILLENKGTLDKYIGDAIVAFYGVPLPVEDHEYRACLTAVQIQKKLGELREKWKSEGNRWPEIVHAMRNRIGINSGLMVTGNMGSKVRMNYTMMGDTVNTAARLEASAKQYGVYTQVAQQTYEKVKDNFIWRELDYVRVVGKQEPVRVYDLIGDSNLRDSKTDNLLSAYAEGIDYYKKQEWKKSLEVFQKSDQFENMFVGRKTNPSRVYISRCNHYIANPPGSDWDGVWTLASK